MDSRNTEYTIGEYTSHFQQSETKLEMIWEVVHPSNNNKGQNHRFYTCGKQEIPNNKWHTMLYAVADIHFIFYLIILYCKGQNHRVFNDFADARFTEAKEGCNQTHSFGVSTSAQ